MLDIREIMSCVPHRYPFLLVDRIQELVPGKSVVAIKNVTINEPMAQAGAMMVLNIPELRGTIAFLTTVNRAKFRRPVVPGDQLVIYTEMGRIFGKMGKVKAHAEVEGKTVAEAELGFMLTKKPEGEK